MLTDLTPREQCGWDKARLDLSFPAWYLAVPIKPVPAHVSQCSVPHCGLCNIYPQAARNAPCWGGSAQPECKSRYFKLKKHTGHILCMWPCGVHRVHDAAYAWPVCCGRCPRAVVPGFAEVTPGSRWCWQHNCSQRLLWALWGFVKVF